MDGIIGESTEGENMVGAGKGETATERLGWCWRREEVGSWFQRQHTRMQKPL